MEKNSKGWYPRMNSKSKRSESPSTSNTLTKNERSNVMQTSPDQMVVDFKTALVIQIQIQHQLPNIPNSSL